MSKEESALWLWAAAWSVVICLALIGVFALATMRCGP
jgi:hypothetical protein